MGHSLLARKRYFTGMFYGGIQKILLSLILFDIKVITKINKNPPFFMEH
jgi:hypothetical protein